MHKVKANGEYPVSNKILSLERSTPYMHFIYFNDIIIIYLGRV